MEIVGKQWLIGLGLLTLASCVRQSESLSVKSTPKTMTNEPLTEDKVTTELPANGSANDDKSKLTIPTHSPPPSQSAAINKSASQMETLTISDAKVSIDPETCKVEVNWNKQNFSETLEAVGPCMVSRRANNEIQEYSAERGTAIVIGSSSKPNKEGWCEVRLHGLLITRSGPEISETPQKPQICGVHNRDEIFFALLADETRPMTMGR